MTDDGPTLFDPPRDEGTIEERFRAFDRKHPEVGVLFQRFAEELLAHGHKRYSADSIIHRIRWECSVNPKREGGFKIDNRIVTHYARRLAAEDARFCDFFEFRRLKSK